MRNKTLLLTIAIFTTSFFSSKIYSQVFNEDDKEGLRNFLRQKSSVIDKTNIEYLGLSASDTTSWYSSEEWLLQLQTPGSITYIDWTWDMSTPCRLTHFEIKSFDGSNSNLAGDLDCKYFSELEYLDLANSQISNLDISENMKLRYLDCSGNKLASLDTYQNNLLTSLNCSENQLTELNLNLNFNLATLNCSDNKLSYLNVSENSNLIGLSCSNNDISKLVLPKSPLLDFIDCSNNNLSDLSLPKYGNLKLLSAGNNILSGIDVSENVELMSIYAAENNIDEFDTSTNNELVILNTSHNNLDKLILNSNPKLEYLFCFNNSLENLNIASNANLLVLNCNNNLLSSLSLDNNLLINELDCSFNDISSISASESATPLLSFVGNDNNLKFSSMPVDMFSSATKKLVYSPQAETDMGEVLYGNEIDFSSEYKIKEVITTYKWVLANDSEIEMNEVSNGIFTALINDDIINYCKMTNSLLPDLTLVFKIKTLENLDTGVTGNNDSNQPFYYDRPSQGIHFINPDDVKYVDIFDSLGRHRSELTNIPSTLSLAKFAAGVYLIKVTMKSGKVVTKKISL